MAVLKGVCPSESESLTVGVDAPVNAPGGAAGLGLISEIARDLIPSTTISDLISGLECKCHILRRSCLQANTSTYQANQAGAFGLPVGLGSRARRLARPGVARAPGGVSLVGFWARDEGGVIELDHLLDEVGRIVVFPDEE